jgi:hypothetical protein
LSVISIPQNFIADLPLFEPTSIAYGCGGGAGAGGGIFINDFATHATLKTTVCPCERTRAANSGS